MVTFTKICDISKKTIWSSGHQILQAIKPSEKNFQMNFSKYNLIIKRTYFLTVELYFYHIIRLGFSISPNVLQLFIHNFFSSFECPFLSLSQLDLFILQNVLQFFYFHHIIRLGFFISPNFLQSFIHNFFSSLECPLVVFKLANWGI